MGQSRYQHKEEVVKCQGEMEQGQLVKDQEFLDETRGRQVEVWEWAVELVEAECLPARQAGAAIVRGQNREEIVSVQTVVQRQLTKQVPLAIR